MGNIIIGIHGLSNKPAARDLEAWWANAMREGLEKNLKIKVSEKRLHFESVYWADVLYGSPDKNPDAYRPADSSDLKLYKENWLDSIRDTANDVGGNVIDSIKNLFGIDKVAERILKKKLEDLYRYHNEKSIRDELRKRLKKTILKNKDKRIMIVAHSMGSIIAYDVLRSLGRTDKTVSIEHFVTIGSPLGIPHVKRRISEENPMVRTPSIVKKWSNLADRRDPVAIDTHLSDDYKANDAGIRVQDDLVLNDWGGINHKSYGYLRTPEFSNILKYFI